MDKLVIISNDNVVTDVYLIDEEKLDGWLEKNGFVSTDDDPTLGVDMCGENDNGETVIVLFYPATAPKLRL